MCIYNIIMPIPKHYIFHAVWCPHCTTLLDTLNDINQMETTDSNKLIIGGSEVRLVEQQEMYDKSIQKILGGYVVKSFPTILSISNKNIKEYEGPRDEISLIEHFKEKQKDKTKKKKTARRPRRIRKIQGGTLKRRKTKRNGILSFLF